MPTYSLDGVTSGLPHTVSGGTAYEIDALSPGKQPSRSYGLTGSAMQITAVQNVTNVSVWAQQMVGRTYVDTVYAGGTYPRLRRAVPEEANGGAGYAIDRNMWCTGLVQVEGFGRPTSGLAHADPLTGWPKTKRASYRASFETLPYKVLTDDSVDLSRSNANTATGGFGGATELYRYVQRSQKGYSAEQRIPGRSESGGFRIAEGTDKGKFIGQVGFRSVSMADVVYKWHRVPVGWPPPKGWTPPGAPSGAGGFWPPAYNPINPTDADILDRLPARERFKGTINADWWDVGPIDGYAFPPGTLLYTGYDDSMKYWDAAGLWACDYLFFFKFKEGGWNKFLNSRGEWVTVTLDGEMTGTKLHETSDFNYLFEYQA